MSTDAWRFAKSFLFASNAYKQIRLHRNHHSCFEHVFYLLLSFSIDEI